MPDQKKNLSGPIWIKQKMLCARAIKKKLLDYLATKTFPPVETKEITRSPIKSLDQMNIPAIGVVLFKTFIDNFFEVDLGRFLIKYEMIWFAPESGIMAVNAKEQCESQI